MQVKELSFECGEVYEELLGLKMARMKEKEVLCFSWDYGVVLI